MTFSCLYIFKSTRLCCQNCWFHFAICYYIHVYVLKVRKVNLHVAQREKKLIRNSQANGESQSEPYFKISNFSDLNNIKLSPGTIWDRTSWCHYVPGQKYFLVPLSLYSGTRTGAKIPEQTPLSQDKITFLKETKQLEKDVLK